MPRYHFDIRDGDGFTEDTEGLEFDRLEDACNEATRTLCEMAKESLVGASVREIAIEVRGERKEPLLKVGLRFEVGPIR